MTRLTVLPVPATGAEDVAVMTTGPDAGAVFTGTEEGSVWRVRDGRADRVARTGGRPLGVEALPDGRLLVCDAGRGLLRIDPADGATEVLAPAGEGLLVTNNAAVAADGTVFFSDSSSVYPLAHWRRDFGEATRTGRLLRRDPDGTVTPLVVGLAFANGVALAGDESFVTVAESGGRTLVRHWLTGDRVGTTDLFVGDLPGYPDNIARGSDGLIWVTISSPRTWLIEAVMRAPRPLRRLVTRLPQALQPAPQSGVHLQAYDDTGRLQREVRIETDAYRMVTGVREHHGRLWLGSLLEPALAVVDLDD